MDENEHCFPKHILMIHLRLAKKNMLRLVLPLLCLSGTLFFGAELACQGGNGFSCLAEHLFFQVQLEVVLVSD